MNVLWLNYLGMDRFNFINQIPSEIRESAWGKALIELIREQNKRIQQQAERIVVLEKTV